MYFPHDLFSGKSVTTSELESSYHAGLLVQFHFLTRQTRAGSACPFTPTGWLSAAVASVLVRKIKKEVKEAEAMEVPAGARIWA